DKSTDLSVDGLIVRDTGWTGLKKSGLYKEIKRNQRNKTRCLRHDGTVLLEMGLKKILVTGFESCVC
uniref:Uncharacterized protein n=1 Tax=Gasterosteus aculeatus TaxID=69293 RepID=G3PG06_GASAC